MKFFSYRTEEKASIRNFRDSCVKDSLEMVVSRKGIAALHRIVTAKGPLESAELGVQPINTLSRRGLIRENDDGEWVATELGLLTLAFAEAGGLIAKRDMSDVK